MTRRAGAGRPATGLLPPLPEDQYLLDTSRVRELIANVRERMTDADSPARACEQIAPLFADLLADRDWLPLAYQAPATASGMGGGIGRWLIFRAADRSLSLFSLVVPPGAMTPVHDHLAWGSGDPAGSASCRMTTSGSTRSATS